MNSFHRVTLIFSILEVLECYMIEKILNRFHFNLHRLETNIAQSKNARIRIAHFTICDIRRYLLAFVLKFRKMKPIEAHLLAIYVSRTHKDSTVKLSSILVSIF